MPDPRYQDIFIFILAIIYFLLPTKIKWHFVTSAFNLLTLPLAEATAEVIPHHGEPLPSPAAAQTYCTKSQQRLHGKGTENNLRLDFHKHIFPQKSEISYHFWGGFLPQLKTYSEHALHHLEVIPKNQLLIICRYPRSEAASSGSHLKFHHRNVLCLKKIADTHFFDNTHS